MKKQFMSNHWKGETVAETGANAISETEEASGTAQVALSKEDNTFNSPRHRVEEGADCKAEKLTIISVALTLEKIQDRSGSDSVNELIGLLRDKNFNINLFRKMVCSREDCRKISEKFMAENIGK